MIRFGSIYKITNLVNNKLYIGRTIKTVEERWKRHLRDKKKKSIHRAFDKYGRENFIIEEIYSSFTNDDLNEKEQYFIKNYNTKAPFGYNLTDGGESSAGYKMSLESIDKVRQANLGRPFSAEHKQKLSNIHKGKKKSKEWRDKIGLAHKNVPKKKKSVIKMSNINFLKAVGLPIDTEFKIIQIKNNQIIGIFDNLIQVRDLGFSSPYIAKTCRGLFPSAYGFNWKLEIISESQVT